MLIKRNEYIYEQYKGNYGARRSRDDLLDDSDVNCVSRQRVARLILEEGLECMRK